MKVIKYTKPQPIESDITILINKNIEHKTDEMGNTYFEYEQEEVNLSDIINQLITYYESIQNSD